MRANRYSALTIEEPTEPASPALNRYTALTIEEPAEPASPALVPYPHTSNFEAFRREYRPGLGQTGTFLGTIKLHGTNSTIMFYNDNTRTPVFQSRNLVLQDGLDNLGTVQFFKDKRIDKLATEIMRIRGSQGHPSSFQRIMIAGELCGKGINKGVAIAKLEKFYAIFNIRVDDNWLDMREYTSIHLPESRIFNIMNFQHWEYYIDFTDPQSVSKFATKIDGVVESIGATCPVAKTFKDANGKAVTGGGEGIVWTLLPPTPRSSIGPTLINFKTKATTFENPPQPPVVKKKQTPSQVAEEFVGYALTPRRLEQGIEWLMEGKDKQVKIGKGDIQKYLGWVIEDMLREERSVMKEMGALESAVKRIATDRARIWYFEHLKKGFS